jgi:hypothetical protein
VYAQTWRPSSSCSSVLPVPKLWKSAAHPSRSAHATAARWKEKSTPLSGDSGANPRAGASTFFATMKSS